MLPVTWQNWGGTASCLPSEVAVPTTVDEVAALVARVRAQGTTVKPVGAGHSFSEIAVTSGVQIDLRAMRGLVSVDDGRARVTVAAGTHLHEIPSLLAPHRLAMANLGDIDRQTIAGATSTGTHGTGAAFGGISTQIVAATIVTGTGEILQLGENDADLAAVALGLGALGIVTDLTLQCVPAFSIRAEERPSSADDAIDGFLERTATHDHHEFYWFPHTDRALQKTNTRLGADVPPSGPGRVRRYLDDEVLSNQVFRLLCAVGARAPRTVPVVAQIAGRALSGRTITDTAARVFVSSRTVRFREMEYAVPLATVPDAVREIRAMIDRKRYRVSFPVEVRAAAADDLMLSTAGGRAGGYIAVHRYHGDDPADTDAYFGDVETIMTELGGRPHWGKMHTRDAGYLRSVYPRFDEFRSVRDRFDPDRLFANRYLDRVLG
ncbi:D-arabinono-1,4-lactone oxidase [Gordonia insulae]|uniref:L-gulono-1,4-lactone dehydrogenase n=1 Tax=Gordonia insulae TaxID=2420509 RepID=A0A3G8JJY0_9ACTN|nr:D-arabinono-1,4-lactone oxidase [Gordonia insulae]AZG45344.1 L-gulono-1,4-lactone dehydrogenase [Gordonia insulae]